MHWMIEFGKYMVAFAGISTATVINIHVRHMEEGEVKELYEQ